MFPHDLVGNSNTHEKPTVAIWFDRFKLTQDARCNSTCADHLLGLCSRDG